MQRDGQKQEHPDVLGWTAALEMYRPMLSYDELGGILEGSPSEFYDQLYKLLGLEALTVAMSRLDVEVKALKEPAVAAREGPRRAAATARRCTTTRVPRRLWRCSRRPSPTSIGSAR